MQSDAPEKASELRVAAGGHAPAVPLPDKLIETRLELVAEAAASVRRTLMAVLVVAGTFALVEWNAYWSNHRVLATPLPIVTAATGKDNPTPDIRKVMRDEWARSMYVTVPLFNARIGPNDVALLGPGALFVMSIWLVWGARRENRAVGTLLLDTKGQPAARSWILHGILNSLVFLNYGGVGTPISGIQSHSGLSWLQEHTIMNLYGSFLSKTTKALVLLPAMTALLLIAGDVFSLFTPSLFISPGGTAFEALGSAEISRYALWNWLPALIFFVLITRNCFLVREYQRGTEETVRAYAALG